MCEKCSEQEVVKIPISEDDDIIIDPILIDTENLTDVCFDDEEFQKGLDNVSYLCGQVTGLVNVGIHPVDILNYLTNMAMLKNNLEISQINKETSIKVAKETSVQLEKNSL